MARAAAAVVAIGFGWCFGACSGGPATTTSGATMGAGGASHTTASSPAASTAAASNASTGTAVTSSSSTGTGGGTVDAGCGDPYPAGPYGLTKGATVPNLVLSGFVDALHDGTATVQTFTLGELYDPSGNEVFPACSQLGAGMPKPKALLLFFAVVWAGPVNQEAMTILPAKHAAYAPAGGQFVTVLIDGPVPGMPPTTTNLKNWVVKYQVDYPSGISSQMVAGLTAFPTNVVVDPRTMKVVDVLVGEPVSSCGNVSLCTTDADCQACVSSQCGDGTACTSSTNCAGKTCTPPGIWSEYAALLGLDGG
jgi:hypothetical protein